MKECSKCKHCYDDEITVCPTDNETPVFTITGSTTISGRYILDQRLGQGGMGIVFRAKHKFLKSLHAIKIILPSLVSDDENLLVRFRQEAILAASIDHPNVIRVTDFGVENDEMPYLVMEYIDGIPLSAYLKEDQPLPLEQAIELFLPVAEGVAEAHKKGIVHRDLKPQNIMVQRNLPLTKAVKVLDFGLAKIKSADSYPSLIQAKTMNIVGSPPYMSPEQWSGDGVDSRTDIYALAVILYQMVTGRLPFKADSMPAMMYQHLTVAPPGPSTFGVSLIPGIEAVILKGLEKDPQSRYPTMDMMLGDLDQAMGRTRQKAFSGTETAVMPPSIHTGSGKSPSTAPPSDLSDSEKKRFYAYFDSKEKPVIADPQLAHEFLEAKDRMETAKTEAINADLLVRELAEAQKEAEAAQDKAIQAKQRIEADVRRQVEAEMQRLASQDQEKREEEAKRLAQEVEARRAAEARANYLAQAALQAQKQAEAERKQREEESQQRELQQGVREKVELEAQALTMQVAEARKQYEEARDQAAREAQQRAEAEAKQKKIEEELHNIALSEAERRKSVEAKAQKFIEDQAASFEKEAQAAKQRLEEARSLIELEAKKREQAEAARLQAEKEAERLSKEIIQVQKQMEEMRQHITYDSQHGDDLGAGPSVPTYLRQSTPGQISLTPLSFEAIPKKKKVFALAVGGLGALVLLLIAGISLFFLFGGTKAPAGIDNTNKGDEPVAAPLIEKKFVPIQGGTFMMGSNDIEEKDNTPWSNQYPAHSEKVGSFLIDMYETTNAQYAEFVKDAQHKPPTDWEKGAYVPTEGNYPVVNVSLDDAMEFAAWYSRKESKNCRLPTEVEWEYAARNGSKATLFPWGNDWLPDNAKLSGRAGPVGSTKDITQDGGIADMLGNVSEWTSTEYSLYKQHPSYSIQFKKKDTFVARGLSFSTRESTLAKQQLMITYRQSPARTDKYPFLGFRLVCEQ